MNTPRVLVAEDNNLVRAGITNILCEEFQVVGAVADGEELVQSALSLRPDVIVSDIFMGRMDGITARKELIAREAEVPFVFVSALGKEVLEMVPAESPVSFVYKIEMLEHLIEAVKSTLSGRRYLSPYYRGNPTE